MQYITIESSPGQPGSTATPVTPSSSPYFGLLRQALTETWKLRRGRRSDPRDTPPDLTVAPMLMPG